MTTTKRETQHTPGPWTVVRNDNTKRARTFITGETTVACLVRQGLPSDEANARLIAAAPDLLAALEALLATADRRAASAGLGWYFQHCPECAGVNVHTPTNTCERHAARAAIAKAKGE